MVLRRVRPAPALVVPDEETWLAWNDADGELPFEPVGDPRRAEVLVLPAHVPHELVPAVRSAWGLMPSAKALATYDVPLRGLPAHAALEHEERAEQQGHYDDRGHHGDGGDQRDGGHDHGDMIAIAGRPSADGLVMEDIDVEVGPLGAVALPGGLVVAATLDGDVVARCDVRQMLCGERDGRPQDVWAVVAWSVAELAVEEASTGVAPRATARWLRLAAVEVERAVAQLSWLHRFCRLLAWPRMTERVRALLRGLVPARGALSLERTTHDLRDADWSAIRVRLLGVRSEAETLSRDLAKSHRFARRTAGLGRVSGDDATQRGMTGPAARASGVDSDARSDDPGYRALRFRPVVRDEGDARARALVRTQEAAQSAGLAAAALEHAGDWSAASDVPAFSAAPAGIVEGARGPVCVARDATGRLRRAVPGARAARKAAGELAVGRGWAAALVTVASFDVPAWQVGR